MLSKTLFLAALLSLTSALPTTSTNNLSPRAGGPEAAPIPSTCTVISPLPTNATANQTYAPGPSTSSAAGYSAYYPPPSSNQTQLYTQCLEQCYGYGGAGSGECLTAYLANNVPVPAGYYGSAGGQLMTACLMYNRKLEPSDFVVAPSGEYTSAMSGDINC